MEGELFGSPVLKTVGSTGGILVMYDRNTFHLVSPFCGDFQSCASSKWTMVASLGPLLVFMVHRTTS